MKNLISIIFINSNLSRNKPNFYINSTVFLSNSLKSENNNFINKIIGIIFFKIIFRKCKSNISKSFIDLLKNPYKDYKKMRSLQELIMKNDNELNISYKDSLIIYRICFFMGFYNLANIFRKKYQDGVRQNFNKSIYYYLESQYINIENGFKLNQPIKNINRKDFKQMSLINDLFDYKDYYDSYNKSSKIDADSINNDFKKLIHKKNIAVVGPVDSREKNAEEIDSFDIVVRLDYSYPLKGCDKKFKGVKTDITYFNAQEIKKFINYSKDPLPKDLKFVCIKNKSYLQIIRNINPNISSRCITFDQIDGIIGHLNMIPLIILDLLCYEPNLIKIFHANLFLTLDTFDGYRPPELNKASSISQSFLKRAFISHDPILQYNMLSNLFNSQKIKGDEGFSYVMSLGLNEYLNKLEENF